MKVEHSINLDKRISPAAHEVWLGFRDDMGAEAFDAWWYTIGKELFVEWCSEHEYYQHAVTYDGS
jgi:hypothetical protein